MNAEESLSALEIRFERIGEEVCKLRKAIEGGVYGPREIVGDVVLVLEGQLKQAKIIFEEAKNPRQQ